jgi:hypothetical protein
MKDRLGNILIIALTIEFALTLAYSLSVAWLRTRLQFNGVIVFIEHSVSHSFPRFIVKDGNG